MTGISTTALEKLKVPASPGSALVVDRNREELKHVVEWKSQRPLYLTVWLCGAENHFEILHCCSNAAPVIIEAPPPVPRLTERM